MHNIYIKGNSMSKRAVMQVLNIMRSKLTYESKLLITRGATVAWHERVQPFHDGTIDIERLAAFASEHLGLPIGDPEQEDLSSNFPNDPLPTHDGLTKWDYCRNAWRSKRKLEFNPNGILIVVSMKTKAI
jgi:hypothetical protein